jgi:hypothetical protein
VAKYKTGRYLVDPETGKLAFMKDDAIMGKLEQRDDGSPVKRQFDAPKTQVLGIVINGVLKQDLNWTMIAIGAMIAVMLELCGISALAFAVGVYVPISVSAPIFVGGLVRWFIDKRLTAQNTALVNKAVAAAGSDPELQKEARIKAEVEGLARLESSPGVLLASGYIAGGSLAGVLLAFLAFSDTLPRDLTKYQYETYTLTAEQSLKDASLDAVKNRWPVLKDKDLEDKVKAVEGLNEDELPAIWAKVPKGTTLNLPRNEKHTVEADTTLGAVAAEKLGREWMAPQVLELNKETIKSAEKLPVGAKMSLPQTDWMTLIPFGILVLVLLLVASEVVLKPKPDQTPPPAS